MTHPLAHTQTTASECLRGVLDAIDDCAAIAANERIKCGRQHEYERTEDGKEPADIAHLLEAKDTIEDVQEGLERLRHVVATSLYTARTTPPAMPNPIGMTASAAAAFGASSDE